MNQMIYIILFGCHADCYLQNRIESNNQPTTKWFEEINAFADNENIA